MRIRHILRGLIRHGGFTTIAVLTIAVGIGATTTMFSVVEAVLLRPLPYGAPERLVMLWGTTAANDRANLSGASLLDMRRESQSLDDVAAFSPRLVTAQAESGLSRYSGVEVTPNFFQVLGVSPHVGRPFSPAPLGREVILSFEYWSREYGAEPDAVGETIRLSGEDYLVRGVAPPGFKIPFENSDLWIRAEDTVPAPPIDVDDQRPEEVRGLNWLRAVARLRDAVDLETAQGDVSVVAERIARDYPDTSAGRGVRLVHLRDEVQRDTRAPLWILFAAVCLMLGVATVNVAGLMIARSDGRLREIALRRALGAGRRILYELLTESLFISLAGAMTGILLSHFLGRILLSLSPVDMFGLEASGLNPTVLIFTVVVAILSGLIFGIAPAFGLMRKELYPSLAESHRSVTAGRQGVRSVLVTSQMAVSVVLLVGAGLLVQSYRGLSQTAAGFRSEGVLTFNTWLQGVDLDEEAIGSTYEQMLRAFEELEGVDAVSAVLGVPLSGTRATLDFVIEGQPAPVPGQEPSAGFQSVAPGYFQTLEIPLISSGARLR